MLSSTLKRNHTDLNDEVENMHSGEFKHILPFDLDARTESERFLFSDEILEKIFQQVENSRKLVKEFRNGIYQSL